MTRMPPTLKSGIAMSSDHRCSYPWLRLQAGGRNTARCLIATKLAAAFATYALGNRRPMAVNNSEYQAALFPSYSVPIFLALGSDSSPGPAVPATQEISGLLTRSIARISTTGCHGAPSRFSYSRDIYDWLLCLSISVPLLGPRRFRRWARSMWAVQCLSYAKGLMVPRIGFIVQLEEYITLIKASRTLLEG